MSSPKRHHWWPQLNSDHWCNANGDIHVLNRDGTQFLGRPNGLGVVRHLYSRELEGGEKNAEIETWFANQVDGPFVPLLSKLIDASQIRQIPFKIDPEKRKIIREFGFISKNYQEYLEIKKSDRRIISNYIAALLVRHPMYLKKLEKFHKISLNPGNNALDNMKYLYELYAETIMRSDFMIVKRYSENEFLFSDGGIVAREPWSDKGGMPFDIHYPVTPDIALQVFPVEKIHFPDTIPLLRAANKGVSGQNRITLQYANKQVFGRSQIPFDFVMKNWGRPAPQKIMFRHVNGDLETKVV